MQDSMIMEFISVAEKAAIAAAKWRGLGKKDEADQAAVEAMRNAFSEINFSGRVVIGEGERDEAPMLFIGEEVGKGGVELDIAVDPLEGTNLCAYNQANALTTLALAPKGSLLFAPDTYMRKIAAGPALKGKIHIDKSVKENLDLVAEALHKSVSEVTVCVLERERHEKLIAEIREAGARVRLISDGDVYGAIATALPGTGIDLYMGTGGAPEGVLACTGLKAIGGEFMGRFEFRNDSEIERAKKTSGVDLDGVLDMDTLVKSDEAFFVACGVTHGELVNGVRRVHGKLATNSVVMNAADHTVRYIKTIYQDK